MNGVTPSTSPVVSDTSAAVILAGRDDMLAPAVVYLLADHLDAVLARGEDLLDIAWRPEHVARCSVTIEAMQRRQREAVDAISALELSLISRALKARERARELASRDHRFRPMARLFAAGTAALSDAAEELGDSTDRDFQTADGIVAYVRSRGLIAADAGSLDDCGAIVVTPQFLVARRIELAPLLDLVAMFLDTLDLHYDLFAEPAAIGPPPAADDPQAEAFDASHETTGHAEQPDGRAAQAQAAPTDPAENPTAPDPQVDGSGRDTALGGAAEPATELAVVEAIVEAAA